MSSNVPVRTETLPAIWADDAQTVIPTPPIANTTYRNTGLGPTELLAGWAYQKIVDSADFNQTLWLFSKLIQAQEQYGIMPWSASTAYKQGGIALGSNGVLYWAKSDNTAVNPVNDTSNTTWGVLINPFENFATEPYVDGQIALCEKLANKTQSLSSSSTTDEYPSAKTVWDNIVNLQNLITSAVQPGIVAAFPKSTAPSGWLNCDGSTISRTTYADLFAVIGTTFGSGDGSTTFKIPDFRGDFLRGYLSGTSSAIGTRQAEGLPNITGYYSASYAYGTRSASGALYGASGSESSGAASPVSVSNNAFRFDASRSNGLYGDSSHVTPRNNAVSWCIKY